MPLYEYVNKATGVRVSYYRPIAERDRPLLLEFERITVPSSVNVIGGAADPSQIQNTILKSYYKEECNAGSRFKSRFTKEQIKKAWSSES